jgi:hypothetical protein
LLTADGNVAEGSGPTVVISLATANTLARLSGTTSAQIVNGVATFPDLAVDRNGTDYRLVARLVYAQVDLPLDTAVSQTFGVTGGPLGWLRFDVVSDPNYPAPTWIPVAAPFSAVVRVTDDAGNTITDATNTVTLGYTRSGDFGFTMAPDGIFGTTTATAVNGVATFNGLSFQKSGLYQLTAVADGLGQGTSVGYTIDAESMTRLLFRTQPQSGTAGAALGAFSVQQVDAYGNGVSYPPRSSYDVTISLGNNPTGATLGGTLTVKAPAGVLPADFGDITISKPGTGYTLVATSPGLASVTSAPFNIQ